jgi:hypothetical protein
MAPAWNWRLREVTCWTAEELVALDDEELDEEELDEEETLEEDELEEELLDDGGLTDDALPLASGPPPPPQPESRTATASIGRQDPHHIEHVPSSLQSVDVTEE